MRYYKALFFGSIGSIVETSEIQRKSYNEACKQYGLEWNWSKQEYLSLLNKSGGKDRISRYAKKKKIVVDSACLLYTSPSPRDSGKSRMPSSA